VRRVSVAKAVGIRGTACAHMWGHPVGLAGHY